MKEFWQKHKAEIGLAILILYTVSLGVATADELFHLGLFPTKLDKLIAQSVEKLGSSDPDEVKQGSRELQEYGDFAVPKLVAAVEGEASDKVMENLKVITGQEFSEPAKWKEWYSEHKKEF